MIYDELSAKSALKRQPLVNLGWGIGLKLAIGGRRRLKRTSKGFRGVKWLPESVAVTEPLTVTTRTYLSML